MQVIDRQKLMHIKPRLVAIQKITDSDAIDELTQTLSQKL